MSDFLTREIIRKIFANMGCIPSKLGEVGPSCFEFKTRESVFGKYEDGTEFNFPIFAAKMQIDASSLHCVFVDLSEANPEFAAVFQMGSSPIYGIRLIYDDEDCGLFMINDEVAWKTTSIYWKAKILSAFEMIVDHGIIWELEDESYLNKKLITLTEI